METKLMVTVPKGSGAEMREGAVNLPAGTELRVEKITRTHEKAEITAVCER